ncbi:endonuclease/exonuclease/phosphatase family protein [Lysobacter sp. LF1]|uniref:Endonuclease/exonuclease/phosphatase family protein n=1 Tax=Lysobacter stagni TaxID=3045172 RepID=A0ABT6XGQ2_9GAMM|nr:endonuclease/exonuclease/phosphatase family protein [Lysobacter sp. LF1]MDI9239239.1 endonuclease/exonuclease/phosphatase family protein [Lysobacter sp. LF1]
MTVSCAPRARRWARAAFAALLAALAACQSVPHEDPRGDDAPLSVVTLNLWHDRNDWPHRQRIIADELQARSPDVILLQEVLQDAALPNQAGTLAQRLGYHWYFVSVDAPGKVRRYGNAILTREPMTQRGSRALQPVDDYRIAGHVRTTVRGRAVDAYVVHLNFTDRSGATRARQIQDLMDFVAITRGDGATVIGGDFNTTAETAELAPLRAGFVDAYAAAHEGSDVERPAHATLNATFNPPARIDRIYARRDAFCRPQAQRILDRPDADGAWASDHFGVWVRLPWVSGGRCDHGGTDTHRDVPRW